MMFLIVKHGKIKCKTSEKGVCRSPLSSTPWEAGERLDVEESLKVTDDRNREGQECANTQGPGGYYNCHSMIIVTVSSS